MLIAELCQNHNGNFSLVEEMVHRASEAGIQTVKIQSIFPELLTKRQRFEVGYDHERGFPSIIRPFDAEYERLSGLVLTIDEHVKFLELCKSLNITAMSTAFAKSTVLMLREIGFENIKVASYDCGSAALLQKIVECQFSWVVVSTGASFDCEIERAAEILKDTNYSFLHCVTKYPTQLRDFNLSRMNYLRKFSEKVGFSDHSAPVDCGLAGTFAAIHFGADIVERHIRLGDAGETRDGPVSIDFSQAEQIVNFFSASADVRAAALKELGIDLELLLGKINRDLTLEELKNRDYYRGRFADKLGSGYDYNWN